MFTERDVTIIREQRQSQLHQVEKARLIKTVEVTPKLVRWPIGWPFFEKRTKDDSSQCQPHLVSETA